MNETECRGWIIRRSEKFTPELVRGKFAWRRAIRLVDGFGEHLFAFLAKLGCHYHEKQSERDQQHAETDRAGKEHARIAPRNQHRAAQILFHQRAEHEAEEQRGRFATPLHRKVSEESET